MGRNYVVEWTIWNFPCDPWKDGRGTACTTDDLASSCHSAGTLGESWTADGGLGWPAPTCSGHVESSSLKKQHARAFATVAEEAKKNNTKPVRKFVLYSLRHTFLTRLGESGCDAWTLARIAGHSSVAMSTRYVHPSEDAVLTAVEKLGEHKIGHSAQRESATAVVRRLLLS
jgi:Phage integrase family